MKRIIQKAREIYEKYGLDNLDFIVTGLEAEIFETPLFSETKIKEIYFPELKTIALASNLDPIQRRYLIAHGLGHHLFHRESNRGYIRLYEEGLFGSKLMGRIEIGRKEKEADLFAAHLLIPEEILDKMLREEWVRDSANSVSALAESFQVPEELMRKRLEFETSNKK